MAKESAPLDIGAVPELLRLANEVRATNRPRVLQHDGEDIAIMVPILPSRKHAKTRKADQESLLAAAGGWKDVDTDKLLEDIYADRNISNRPLVEL